MHLTQYPEDFNPPNRGVCREVNCGVETRAHDKRWLDLCPRHWQELSKGGRVVLTTNTKEG